MSDNRFGIFIHGLPSGQPTPVDGKWLSFYDPRAFNGRGEIRGTHDPMQALAFPTHGEAIITWQLGHGTRTDGRPNKPLTAFTVSIEPLP